MLFAVALSLNLPGCNRDDPNTRALSSSHYGYVLSAFYSAGERERVIGNVATHPRGRREGGLASARWVAIEVLLHNGIVVSRMRRADRTLREQNFHET